MRSRGQNAMEYLLLIAGGVLIGTVVLLMIFQTAIPTGGNFLDNQMSGYQNIGLPGNGGTNPPTPPVTGAPNIVFIASTNNLPASAYPGSVRLDFDVTNISSSATMKMIGWNDTIPNLPSSITIANFNSLPAPNSANDFTAIISTIQSPQHTGFITEVMPQENHSYSFALLACNPPSTINNPTSTDCTLAVSTTTSKDGTTIGPISVSLTNGFTPEVVWDWDGFPGGNACNAQDFPDMPARALVNDNDELLITRSHSHDNHVLFGSDFDPLNLSTNCSEQTLMSSAPEIQNNSTGYSTPDQYNEREWFGTIYRVPNTNTVHAIVHNEYHDPRYASSSLASGGSGNGPCKFGDASSANQCGYFSLTYASSSNGGHTFSQPSPIQVVATSFLQWDPFAPQGSFIYPMYGVMMNSNIIKRGSYYYMLVHAINDDSNPHFSTRGVCVGRTSDLSAPSSWRFWDGTSYSIRLGSPYANPSEAPLSGCTFVGKNKIDQMVQSITYNTYLGKFLLVGASNWPSAPFECGFYFATSDDLITWDYRQQIIKLNPTSGTCNVPGQDTYDYPSLIDHAQLADAKINIDPNFEISGQNPYLYFRRKVAFDNNPSSPTYNPTHFNRDLERVQITFSTP